MLICISLMQKPKTLVYFQPRRSDLAKKLRKYQLLLRRRSQNPKWWHPRPRLRLRLLLSLLRLLLSFRKIQRPLQHLHPCPHKHSHPYPRSHPRPYPKQHHPAAALHDWPSSAITRSHQPPVKHWLLHPPTRPLNCKRKQPLPHKLHLLLMRICHSQRKCLERKQKKHTHTHTHKKKQHKHTKSKRTRMQKKKVTRTLTCLLRRVRRSRRPRAQTRSDRSSLWMKMNKWTPYCYTMYILYGNLFISDLLGPIVVPLLKQ